MSFQVQFMNKRQDFKPGNLEHEVFDLKFI